MGQRQSNAAPALRAPVGVHTGMNERLKAYSIFVPHAHIKLFNFVLLRPGHRHLSPTDTGVNLRDVLDYVKEGAALTKDEARRHDEFVAELNLLDPASGTSRVLGDVEQETAVFSSSVREAYASVSPADGVGAGARGARERRAALVLKLKDVEYRRYRRSKLKALLWDYRAVILASFVRYAGDHLGAFDRELLGIVTNEMTGTVTFSKMDQRDANAGLSILTFFTGGFNCFRGQDDVYRDLRGVAGIHFIFFPVEKMGPNKWTFYQPVSLNDSEQDDDGIRDNFSIAKRWTESTDGSSLQYTSGAPESEAVTKRSDAPSTSTSDTDVPMKLSLAHGKSTEMCRMHVIDIDDDVKSGQYAEAQFKLATRYKNRTNDPHAADLALRLFRSAYTLGYTAALAELVDCHRRGLGEEAMPARVNELLGSLGIPDSQNTLLQLGAGRGLLEPLPKDTTASQVEHDNKEESEPEDDAWVASSFQQKPEVAIFVNRKDLKKEVSRRDREGVSSLRLSKRVRVEALSEMRSPETLIYVPDDPSETGLKPFATESAYVNFSHGGYPQNIVSRGSDFAISFVSMYVAKGKARKERLQYLLYSLSDDVDFDISKGFTSDAPKDRTLIHYDPITDGFDNRAYGSFPVRASKSLYLQRSGKGGTSSPVEAVPVRFRVLGLDQRWNKALGGMMSSDLHRSDTKWSEIGSSMEVMTIAVRAAQDAGMAGLKAYQEPTHVLSSNEEFLLAPPEWEWLEKKHEVRGPYLQYGYYVFLSKPVDAQLYAQTSQASAHLRLFLRRTDRNSRHEMKHENEYVPLTDVSYTVIKVSRGAQHAPSTRSLADGQRLVGMLDRQHAIGMLADLAKGRRTDFLRFGAKPGLSKLGASVSSVVASTAGGGA